MKEEFIKEVYSEIHAPDALFGKVMNMKKRELRIKKAARIAAATAAIAAVGFVASNGICYAATGNTWVSNVLMYVNGEPVEKEVTWHESGDALYGTVELDDEQIGDNKEISVAIEGNGEEADSFFIQTTPEDGEDKGRASNDSAKEEGTLKKEGDQIMLTILGQKFDVTKDFEDGEATGNVDYNGESFVYKVTGTLKDYDLTLERK